jgi:PAS domain S-box-containing protein
MRRFIPPLIVVATALALLLIAALVRQNLVQIETMRADAAQVEHTVDVQAQLDAVLLALAETETNQLAYLLSGADGYLAAYRGQQAHLDSALARLGSLLTDNPAQIGRYRELRAAVTEKLAAMNQAIAVREASGLAAAVRTLPTDGSRPIMARVQTIAGRMVDEETQLLEARRDRLAFANRSARRGRIGSGILSAGLLVGVVLLAAARARARDRAARLVAEQREHLGVTLESIGDGVIATDLEGRVTLMNSVAAALTGWTPQEAAGRRVHEVFNIISEETRTRAENPVDRVLKEGKVQGLANHTLLISRDGTERPVDDSGAPIRGADGPTRGAVLVFRDVSDRRRQEQALRDSERRFREAAAREQAARTEAETANRLKDEFLAVLSHELRTPLNAVLGWTQILQGGGASQATAIRGLSSIKRNAEAQQRLVEDLLDVSRIVTRKFPVERRPTEVRSAVSAAIEGVRPAAAAKALVLNADLDGPALANADPHRIQQLASNLLSNAVKFTPGGGRIDVSLKSDRDRVRLTVSDSGEGIAGDLLPHIFDRFRQGDGSSTRAHGGLGLGLAIAKYIVEAHDGTIEAISGGPGQGSTFVVEVPAGEPMPVAVEASAIRSGFATAADRRFAGVVALVVDDEADSRELLSYALQEAGIEVVEAPSGRTAIEVALARRPTVILTDLQMADMDGFELLEAVRARYGAGAPPAVAISARASSDDAARASEAGFVAHLAKPVDLNRLLATIRSAIA